jgi:tRNA modification GTPase
MSPDRDTIFALSSGRPPAAIAVIRISGPHAGAALKALTGKIPEPRKARFARLRDPQTNEPIDEALALWFPAPASETGEDVAELQLHGGRAVIAATLAALSGIDGLRPAEAGEFTRRAFENGKLDLTAVEGLADLVMAETQGQRRQALRQMQGALRERAESWRERLIRALALTEARIDFSDEADVPADLAAPALALARGLASEIEAVLSDGHRGERLRDGLVVAIAGPPNAGKSTLLNRIARREAAIVSPYAGTTRDVIEVHLDLDGWPVTLLDTAGIRDSDDPVEREGVRRARQRAAAADLVLWVVDASAADDSSSSFRGRSKGLTRNPDAPAGLASRSQTPPFRRHRNSDGASEVSPGFRAPVSGRARNDEDRPPTWLIRNKIDLVGGAGRNESNTQSIDKTEPGVRPNKTLPNMVNERLTGRNESIPGTDELIFSLSGATGEGFEALFSALTQHASVFLAGAEPALITRERQRHALEDSLAALQRVQTPEVANKEDLLAEELRTAARALGRLTGRVDVEDILDVIFRDFCIGK